MNWVGGSRNRLVMKNNAKKQREFFEKRKMQQKLRHLGIPVPASSPGTSSGSMDLVTLFVVNQIAAKKESRDPPKVAVLGSSKGGSKHKRPESLVLPMSPCSPSQLSIVESPAQDSAQGMRKRTHVITQPFKCRQLSPVLESAFSDNSASDYLPPRAVPLSPFSSTSSASSGQGIFPLQFSLQQRSQTQAQPWLHCFPPPWDSSELEQTKLQTFSQPRGTTCNIPSSCGPNPLYQLETPKAAQVLFGSPEPDKIELRERERQEVRFSFSQLADKKHMLDFTLNQSETEQQFEEDVFRGFCNEEYEREGSAKSKMYLKDETPIKSTTPQTVPDSECEVEHSNSTYTNISGPGHKTDPINDCGYLPSYSCIGGYLSSDSNDEEECFQPCVSTPASSCINQACCADTPRTNQASQGKLKQRHSQSLFRSSTPLIKAKMNLRDDQNMEIVACPDKVCESIGQQKGRSTSHCLSPHPLAQTQHCLLCKCKKTSGEMREVGSQTLPIVETCNASTQCDTVAKDTEFSLCLPPVDVSVQHPATGRQTDTAAEPNTHTVSSGNSGGEQCVLWSNKSNDYSLSRSCTLNSDDRVIPGSINPFLDALIVADDKGKKTGESRGETGQQENGPLMKDLSYEVREEITSSTRVNRLSGEAKTLQEIADILLLLKQRKVGCEGRTV